MKVIEIKAPSTAVAADMTGEVLSALGSVDGPATIRFSPGEYHFFPDRAAERFLCPSNNRSGLKRVAFPIEGVRDLVIDGQGARFVFHGVMLPMLLDGCSGVVLRDFSIDWVRPFYSQGDIVGFDEGGIEIEIDRGRYPHRVEGGRLIFEGEGWESPLTQGIFEIDRASGAPAYLSGDNLMTELVSSRLPAREIGRGRIRFDQSFARAPRIGNVLLLRHFLRLAPGIFLQRSRDTRIEGVSVHHASAMGVIGQFCENVTLERFAVGPTPGSGRAFSVAVDATHFVNCRGLIRLEASRFSHQMDDPCNVHGINSRFHSREDARTAVFELVHHEQHGVPVAFAGDRVHFCSNVSLLPFGEAIVESALPIDGRLVRVAFAGPLPDRLGPGDVMENLTWTADLHVTGCQSGPNRARGYLVSTPGRVLIENNRISAAGACIKISGDANYWFESGAVRDVLIRNNLFTDCCYGPEPWGMAAIDIDPEIEDPWGNEIPFHRNIRIVGNTFRTFDPSILYARSVDGIEFSGNTVERTDTYPETGRLPAILNFDACRNIRVEGNTIGPDIGKPLEAIHDAPHGRERVKPQPSLDAALAH